MQVRPYRKEADCGQAEMTGPMKIKKFVAPSMGECLLKVKRELGEDAVILDSRKVARGGPFSFLLTDMVEVVASTDGADMQVRPYGKEKSWGKLARETVDSGQETGDRRQETAETGRPYMALAGMTEEIKALKESVQRITDHLKFQQLPSLPTELEILHCKLLENGVDDKVAAIITQEITLRLAGSEFEDRELLQRALYEGIGKRVKTDSGQEGARRASPLRWGKGGHAGLALETVGSRGAGARADTQVRPYGGARIIALVGPTGVGKTTTLAKMATHPAIFGRKRVALVSADTYRMAAVEQLKTFATIANIPMEAVYRPVDMRRAIGRFLDSSFRWNEQRGPCDVILIDTAGRSQNDRSQLNDLVAFLEHAGADEVHLVLSISTRLDDQLDVISKFQAVNPKRLIFTKLDETTSYGMILNVCFYLSGSGTTPTMELGGSRAVSMLTCGQNVPDDIICPSQAQMVRLVSERSYFREEFLQRQGKI